MADLSPADLIAATDALFDERRPWEGQWTQVRTYALPDGPDFNRQDIAGQTNRDQIVSGAGEAMLEDAADGLVGLSCQAGTRWMGLSTPGLDENMHDERVWLDLVNDVMLGVFDAPASRFVPAIKAFALEWLGLGTACLFANGRPGTLPIFEHRPLAQIAVSEGESGFVNETVWEFEWTAKKAAERWGRAGTLPDAIAKAAADPAKRQQKFKFRHYVYERRDYDDRKYDRVSRRFRECWIAVDGKALLEEGGFFTNPYIVARVGKSGAHAYGRGRGAKALPDIKMLQRVRRATIQGAEKVINPPTQSPDDGVMGAPDLRPGMDNPVRPEYLMRGAGIQPILTGARPDIGMDFEESIKADIGAPLLSKVLHIPAEPRMLVDQELRLREEAMQQAGPIVGEFQTEALGPLVDRAFDIMARQGMFGRPESWPQALRAAEIKPTFEAPAARARNIGVVRAIAQRNQIMAPIWQADPALLDLHDFEREERTIGQILGIPADLYRSPDQFKAMQKERTAAADAREQREAGKDATTMLKNATPALQMMRAANANQGEAVAA